MESERERAITEEGGRDTWETSQSQPRPLVGSRTSSTCTSFKSVSTSPMEVCWTHVELCWTRIEVCWAHFELCWTHQEVYWTPTRKCGGHTCTPGTRPSAIRGLWWGRARQALAPLSNQHYTLWKCVGHTTKCVQHSSKFVGHTSNCVGHTDSCVGHTWKCFGHT
jgi:hypothetical protein